MSGPKQQRRRRASGVLAAAIRKDLERDANGGAEPDAPKRRERRTSAAFRRASFQAGPVPLRSEEIQQQQRQQGQSRRGDDTNMARRASSSNLARRGSSSALHEKGGTSSSRRTPMSKKISPSVTDKKPATKTSPYPSQQQQHPVGDTNGEDDDDALIMACIANMESRSKPGYRPTPASHTSEPRSKRSTTSTNADQKQEGVLDAFLESQKQERAALAYFQAQQAEQAAIFQAMQQGGEKTKQISPQPSLTSTNTALREDKPISSELARHRACIKAAEERENNAFTGMSLEQHKARIANQYSDHNKEKSAKKTGKGDNIKSSKNKKSKQSQGKSSQKKGDRQTESSSPRTASSEDPSSSIGPKKNWDGSTTEVIDAKKTSSRPRTSTNDKCEEPDKSSNQPKAERRVLEGSLRKLENHPTESSSTASSTIENRRKQLSACGESVSSSSKKNVILAASQSIRSQGYDALGESHRSLRSLDDGLFEEDVDLESEKQRDIQAIADKIGDDEIDDLANLINDVECVFNSASSLLSTSSSASLQCHHQKPKRPIKRKEEKRQASPPRSHSGTPPPSQDLCKFDRGEHFLSSDDPILFFQGISPSHQKGTMPGDSKKDSKLILGRPSKRPGTSGSIEFVDEPVAIVKIPHLHDMTRDEKLALWFSQAEHRQMRKKILKDIYALHREDTERITCSRGLEYATCEAEWHHRKTNKDNALSCVLEEQSRQKKFEDHDAAELATVSTIHSQVSQFYAREKGEADERYVDQHVRDGNNKSKADATNHENLGQSNSSLQEVPSGPGFLPAFFTSFRKSLSSEEIQTGRDASASSANHSSHLLCDFGERVRRASGLSITDEDKHVVGSKAA